MNAIEKRLRELEKQAGVRNAMAEVMCLNYFYGDKAAVGWYMPTVYEPTP